MKQLDIEGRFFEGPRWHDRRWWVSDMTNRTVSTLGPNFRLERQIQFEDRPSGLGWLPDGSMIVVAMDSRTLIRVDPGSTDQSLYADLGEACGDTHGYINDMVIAPGGHIYVGFDPDMAKYGFQSEAGAIIYVSPERHVSIAATGLHFPNGMVVTSDNKTLIIAETGSPRLTAFVRLEDGTLAQRRLWATIEPSADQRSDQRVPLHLDEVGLDGCAVEADGSIWVANSSSTACLRIAPGGGILDAVFIPESYRCLACALGGEDGRTLLVCGLQLSEKQDLITSRSHLFAFDLTR